MIDQLIPFYKPSEKVLIKSDGCYLYDTNNKRYTDFEAGVWCANLGFNHARITDLLKEQSERIIHHGYRFRNEQSEHLAEKLHQKIGFNGGQSVFLSSGSEAVNLSITIARHLTGRSKTLKINNSFLSAYGFGQLSADNPFKTDVEFNNTEAIANIDFSDIAAFVFESGGASVEVVKFPEKTFAEKLVEAARNQGAKIIVDEVTTGFGRTGKWFGFMHYDIRPDMVVTAKGLGNGFPISAVSIDPVIAKELTQKPLMYLQSHINDPLGCAVGLEVIQAMEDENIIEASRSTGEYFLNQLQLLQQKHPKQITEVRGRGLMLALSFSEEVNGDQINKQLFEHGLVVGFKLNTIRLLPPLTIQKADIDELTNTLDTLLSVS